MHHASCPQLAQAQDISDTYAEIARTMVVIRRMPDRSNSSFFEAKSTPARCVRPPQLCF